MPTDRWRKSYPQLYEGVEDNRLVARDGTEEVCDFCCAESPTWEYPAAPMEIVGSDLIGRSDDEWGACDRCHELLEANNIGGLVEHCVQAQANVPHDPSWVMPPLSIARRTMRRNILRFMDARTGPPRRYEPNG